jgi:hypothetical protein
MRVDGLRGNVLVLSPATVPVAQVRSAKGFDGRASPDDNAAFAAFAFRGVEAHRGLEAGWD